MQKSFRGCFRVVVATFALIGALFVMAILFLPQQGHEAAPAPVPTLTSTPAPTPTRLPTPTPDPNIAYLAHMRIWYNDALAWVEQLEHETKVPSADRDAALVALETRAQDLLAALRTVTPSPRHAETHEHLITSMEHCVQAVSYWRQGDASLSNIHGGTCTIGLTLMADVLAR